MPTTTNLGITYPDSTAYVTNGAADMGVIATGIDALYGALTTYTPTLGNVSGGTVTGRFRKLGKIGIVHVQFTAGTATAAGLVTATLPAGWTTLALGVQGLNANNGATGIVYAYASGTTITVTSSTGGANFALGASVASVRVTGWVIIQ